MLDSVIQENEPVDCPSDTARVNQEDDDNDDNDDDDGQSFDVDEEIPGPAVDEEHNGVPEVAASETNKGEEEKEEDDDDEDDDDDETNKANPVTTTEQAAPNTSSVAGSLNSVYGNYWGMVSSLSLILNAGLMIYAHVGLSAVILSNQQRIQQPVSSSVTGIDRSNNTASNSTNGFVPTGNCVFSDNEIWVSGGNTNKTQQSNWCARQYDGGTGCLLDTACTTTCFVSVWNYTTPCAQCFADIPVCSLGKGCAFICQKDGLSEECNTCTEPCNEIFDACSGLERPAVTFPGQGNNNNNSATTSPASTTDNNTESSAVQQNESTEEICARQQEGVDAEEVDEFYIVYELMFFSAVKTAWNSNARLLAVIVVLFSGLWPYTKNVILALAWYLPLTIRRRDWVLTWLRRLGKYTFVDIYVIIVIMVGVVLEINVADGVPLVIKAEPRPAIISFLVATVWEFIQIEWIVGLQDKLYTPQDHLDKIRRTVPAWYRDGVLTNAWNVRGGMWLVWTLAIGLLLTGSILELIRFTSVLGGETAGCIRSYNVYELGAELVSDFFLFANNAKPGVWTMAISFFLFVVVFPLYGHLVHALSFLFDIRQRHMCLLADQCWTFASVEVLVLAIFTVEFKFSALIGALAGNEGSQFFGIVTNLGPGFFILMAYSVFGGLSHYFFKMRLLLETQDNELVGKL